VILSNFALNEAHQISLDNGGPAYLPGFFFGLDFFILLDGKTMTDKIPVSFTCKVCGTKLTWSDDAVDRTEITCQKCGKVFGTYADLKHTALEAVRAKAEAVMKDAFKRR
jgi:hypothetical protein